MPLVAISVRLNRRLVSANARARGAQAPEGEVHTALLDEAAVTGGARGRAGRGAHMLRDEAEAAEALARSGERELDLPGGEDGEDGEAVAATVGP